MALATMYGRRHWLLKVLLVVVAVKIDASHAFVVRHWAFWAALRIRPAPPPVVRRNECGPPMRVAKDPTDIGAFSSFNDDDDDDDEEGEDDESCDMEAPSSNTWRLANDFPTFLNQVSIQSFLFLLKSLHDPQTVFWLENYTQPVIAKSRATSQTSVSKNLTMASSQAKSSQLLSYHGLGALNMTLFPTWNVYFANLLELPSEQHIIESDSKYVAAYDWDVEPTRLSSRLLSVRTQITREMVKDLDVLSTLGDWLLENYHNYTVAVNAAARNASLPTPMLPRPNLLFLDYPTPGNDLAPSPLRKGNFDLVTLLATQEAVHRILNENDDDSPPARAAHKVLSSFYLQRHYTHFAGRQHYHRGNDFVLELWASSPVLVRVQGRRVLLVDPKLLATLVLQTRARVATEWRDYCNSMPRWHTDIQRLQLTAMMAKGMMSGPTTATTATKKPVVATTTTAPPDDMAATHAAWDAALRGASSLSSSSSSSAPSSSPALGATESSASPSPLANDTASVRPKAVIADKVNVDKSTGDRNEPRACLNAGAARDPTVAAMTSRTNATSDEKRGVRQDPGTSAPVVDPGIKAPDAVQNATAGNVTVGSQLSATNKEVKAKATDANNVPGAAASQDGKRAASFSMNARNASSAADNATVPSAVVTAKSVNPTELNATAGVVASVNSSDQHDVLASSIDTFVGAAAAAATASGTNTTPRGGQDNTTVAALGHIVAAPVGATDAIQPAVVADAIVGAPNSTDVTSVNATDIAQGRDNDRALVKSTTDDQQGTNVTAAILDDTDDGDELGLDRASDEWGEFE